MRKARGSGRARTELPSARSRTEAARRLERPVVTQESRRMSTEGGGCGVAPESTLRPVHSWPYRRHLVPRPHSPSPALSCPVGWAQASSQASIWPQKAWAELLSMSPRTDPSLDSSLPQVYSARGTCPRETDPCQPPQEHPRGVTQTRLGHVCHLIGGLRVKVTDARCESGRLFIMARRKTVSFEGVVAVGELVRVFPHSSWRPRSAAACALR